MTMSVWTGARERDRRGEGDGRGEGAEWGAGRAGGDAAVWAVPAQPADTSAASVHAAAGQAFTAWRPSLARPAGRGAAGHKARQRQLRQAAHSRQIAWPSRS